MTGNTGSLDRRAGDSAEAALGATAPAVPPPSDDDADVMDAEIVETDARAGAPDAYPGAASGGGATSDTPPTPEYSDAGVPSLDYVRGRIRGRYSAAFGGAELAASAAPREVASRAEENSGAAVTAREQQVAMQQAAIDRLAEIRRSIPARWWLTAESLS